MAKVFDPDPEQQKQHELWYDTLPDEIKRVVDKYPPTHLYRVGDKGPRVGILAYAVDGTVTVGVSGAYNRVMFDYVIGGVPLEELREADLPDPDEDLGTTLTAEAEVEQYIASEIVAANGPCDDPECSYCQSRRREVN